MAGSRRSHARASLGWAFLSALILLTDVSIPYVIFLGYGVQPPFLLVLAVVATAALGGIASQSPGGVAATEAILISLFVRAGFAIQISLGVTLLSRLLGFYLFTLVGWGMALRLGVRATVSTDATAPGEGAEPPSSDATPPRAKD